MIDHSTLIRKLRTERNISQRKLAKGICPRSTLSSFELEGRFISADLLIKFLDRLNVRLDEYWHLYFNDDLDKEICFTDLINLSSKTNTSGLRELLSNTKVKLAQSEDVYWRLILFKTRESLQKGQSTFSYEKFLDQESSEIQHFRKYLEKIEEWGIFELALFSNILYYLPEEFVELISRSLSKKANLKIHQHREVYLRTTLNIGSYFIEKLKFPLTLKVISNVENVLSYEDLHWSCLMRFQQDLCRELTDNVAIDYSYLGIYETLGFQSFQKNLIAYRERIIVKWRDF